MTLSIMKYTGMWLNICIFYRVYFKHTIIRSCPEEKITFDLQVVIYSVIWAKYNIVVFFLTLLRMHYAFHLVHINEINVDDYLIGRTLFIIQSK